MRLIDADKLEFGICIARSVDTANITYAYAYSEEAITNAPTFGIKDVLEILQKIKDKCEDTECINCPFEYSGVCQLGRIGNVFRFYPSSWNLEELEEILNETD